MFKGAKIEGVTYPIANFDKAMATAESMGLHKAYFGGVLGSEIISKSKQDAKNFLIALGLYKAELTTEEWEALTLDELKEEFLERVAPQLDAQRRLIDFTAGIGLAIFLAMMLLLLVVFN